MGINSSNRNLSKYLENYSEPECHEVTGNNCYEHCLIIPVCDEEYAFIDRLLTSPPKSDSLLIVLVINQPDTQEDRSQNQALWNQLLNSHTTLAQGDNDTWLASSSDNIHFLLVDRFHKRIPRKQGVGLARKIGGDIACRLYIQGQLKSPWAHHTDADVILPENYFLACHKYDSTMYSALVYPYQHINNGDESLFLATKLYEKALQYYVDGLKQAGSPYAYHTLGSCITCTHTAYAACRGFPKKSGGEDFYLLNKLAKVAAVGNLTHPILHIESRLSERVPFGTGPAVKKIIEENLNENNYLYYNPNCFKELRDLLQNFEGLYDTDPKLWLHSLSPILQETLKALDIEVLFTHLQKQGKTKEQHLKQCHGWLDAFKSLKLMHFLEKKFPKQALKNSLQANKSL